MIEIRVEFVGMFGVEKEKMTEKIRTLNGHRGEKVFADGRHAIDLVQTTEFLVLMKEKAFFVRLDQTKHFVVEVLSLLDVGLGRDPFENLVDIDQARIDPLEFLLADLPIEDEMKRIGEDLSKEGPEHVALLFRQSAVEFDLVDPFVDQSIAEGEEIPTLFPLSLIVDQKERNERRQGIGELIQRLKRFAFAN